jgi:thiol-disulfide isomerase/thioredoxin
MNKKSNQINKILTTTSLKECNGTNTGCSKSKKSSLYEDMYQEQLNIVELKYKDFHVDKKTKSIQCIHPLFKNSRKGMIIFYAPWCKHCNDMFDELVELSINYVNVFPIGVVNIEDIKNKNDQLVVDAKVSRYPTIKMINRDLYIEDYNQEFTKDNMIYYIHMNM